MRKAFQTKKKQNIDEKWLQVMHPNFEGVQGEVLVSFELLPHGTVSVFFVQWIHSKSCADYCFSGIRKISKWAWKKEPEPIS